MRSHVFETVGRINHGEVSLCHLRLDAREASHADLAIWAREAGHANGATKRNERMLHNATEQTAHSASPIAAPNTAQNSRRDASAPEPNMLHFTHASSGKSTQCKLTKTKHSIQGNQIQTHPDPQTIQNRSTWFKTHTSFFLTAYCLSFQQASADDLAC